MSPLTIYRQIIYCQRLCPPCRHAIEPLTIIDILYIAKGYVLLVDNAIEPLTIIDILYIAKGYVLPYRHTIEPLNNYRHIIYCPTQEIKIILVVVFYLLFLFYLSGNQTFYGSITFFYVFV